MRYSLPALLKGIGGLLLLLALIGYGFFQVRHFVRGPVLSITAPEDGEVVTDPRLTITGSAHNISFITLNESDIFTDENGTFSQELLLAPGYSIIEVSVTDRFKRTRTESREVYYDAPRVAFDPHKDVLDPALLVPETSTTTTGTSTDDI